MGEALRKRRWLLSSTVESHDGLMLELPGLGNSQSIEALCNLVQRWNLEVIFLTETKMNIVGMKKVKLKLGYVKRFLCTKIRKRRGIGDALEKGGQFGDQEFFEASH